MSGYLKIKVLTSEFIAIVGFLLTALGTYLSWRSTASQHLIHDELLKICGILVVIFGVGWFYYYHHYHLAKSVIEGRDTMSNAHAMISDLAGERICKSKIQQQLESLSLICQEISKAFEHYHDVGIAVCIHYLNSEDKKYYVNCLCRDVNSRNRPRNSPRPGKTKDYIEDNSDFRHLFSELSYKSVSKVYYLNNFLPFSPYYRNSHFSDVMTKKYYNYFGWFHRAFRWELIYKSTLVIPMVIHEKNTPKIIGFLSIDSPRVWAFSTTFDLPSLQSVAASLAPVVNRFVLKNQLDKKDE